ncbi:MAG: potassium-transporting ATPase subunit KdpC [Gammaproteobacteria bacterium]|jgi:K+-transporting ATPase ATPase C chain
MTQYKIALKIALKLLLIITIITGIIYPLLITGLAQALFPFKANGSLIVKDQKIVGSELLGQLFEDPKYFWGRPSATSGFPYNTMNSGGSNLGPLNKQLIINIKNKIIALKKTNLTDKPIPIELVTASASGLDPHISLDAARYQATRIAKVRKLSEDTIMNLVNKFTENPQFGFLGETRINVLKLNLALDEIK